MVINVEDLRKDLRGEYHYAVKILNKYAVSGDPKKAEAANKILENKDLMVSFVERQYKRNKDKVKKPAKSEKKKLTGWKKLCKMITDRFVIFRK